MSTEQDDREQRLTDEVAASFDGAADPRLRTVMQALTRHLHAFLREVRLTEDEWRAAITFLTETGHLTDDRRQEFVLLSDVLGASMQTIAINNEAYGNATEATVFGPFFVAGSPSVPLGGDIAGGGPGEPCWVEGTVTSTDGTPVPGALIEVWEADEDGIYDVQYDDDRVTARGHLHTDANGSRPRRRVPDPRLGVRREAVTGAGLHEGGGRHPDPRRAGRRRPHVVAGPVRHRAGTAVNLPASAGRNHQSPVGFPRSGGEGRFAG